MHTLKYIISLCFCFVIGVSFAQQKDSIIYKKPYGLRIGLDISKPILSTTDKSYSGFEIVGDYRISDSWYLASEIGFEERTSSEDFSNSTSKGQYIRLGANYNSYENWLVMNNEIYVGLRYGFSIFDQTLNSYTSNQGNSSYFPASTITPQTTTNLKAHWLEFQFGIKHETFKNLFIGISASYKIMVSVDEPSNFKTLYAPGFNRVFESQTGFGFNYTLSYLIPFVNK